MSDSSTTTDGVPKKIVVGTDGSETAGCAVAKATSLAAALGSELVILSAYKKNISGVASPGMDFDSKWVAIVSDASEKLVQQAVEEARAKGVRSVSGRAVAGDPADVLIAEAENEGADLLVVGSKGMQSSARFFLGSVPNKVSHHAPCDLLIVETGG